MTPIRLTDGLPTQGERPVILLAARWQGSGTLAKDRRWARDLAERGFTGILAEGADQAEAADAARRAGLLALVPAGSPLSGPHVATGEGALAPVVVDDETAAFTAFCSGARVIAGEEATLDGLAAFLALAAADEAWVPLADRGTWQLTAAGPLLAAFGPEGGEVELVPQPGQSLHWFEPADGLLLGIATAPAGEPQVVVTAFDVPVALLLAPSRWYEDDVAAA